MNNLNTFPKPDLLPEGEEIRNTRQRLTHFTPAAGSLEVLFRLPNGEEIRVPIQKLSTIRALSREVRNYLAEEQLAKQFSSAG